MVMLEGIRTEKGKKNKVKSWRKESFVGNEDAMGMMKRKSVPHVGWR